MNPIETAAALSNATAASAEATRLAAHADTNHAAALAGLATAVDAHDALAGRMAAGTDVKAAEAARAASAVADARAHVALTASAKQIAADTLAARDRAAADAEFDHSRHAVAECHRKRASACENLADAADAFALALNRWSDAGLELEQTDHRFAAARHQRTGQRPNSFAGFDNSKTATYRGAASLRRDILQAIRENPIDSVDFRAEAAHALREAGL